MKVPASRFLGVGVLLTAFLCGRGLAQPAQKPLVRIAELEIDPIQLDRYKEAVTQEIETSIREEPDVLYADEAAYSAHMDSVHFKKLHRDHRSMIKSRKLFETVPIMLGTKSHKALGSP
jgi:quinol monooxygenase YgiN